jgi:hypothetical protein
MWVWGGEQVYEESGSVRYPVALSPQEALGSAEALMTYKDALMLDRSYADFGEHTLAELR